jgi:hypothetical protein
MRVIEIEPTSKIVICEKYVNEDYVLQSNEMKSDFGLLGQIHQSDGSFITPSLTLEGIKEQKIVELTNFYKQSIATFKSSALGSMYTYLADDTSIGKFNAEYSFINSNAYDGSPVNWFTVELGGAMHTKNQFIQAWLDGRSLLASQFDKWDNLVKQVKLATTSEEVNGIVW